MLFPLPSRSRKNRNANCRDDEIDKKNGVRVKRIGTAKSEKVKNKSKNKRPDRNKARVVLKKIMPIAYCVFHEFFLFFSQAPRKHSRSYSLRGERW